MSLNSLMKSDRRWVAVSIFVLVLGVMWTFVSRVPSTDTTNGLPPPSPREGFTAPDIKVDRLGGGQVSLSDLRGKVVLVNFWATWCPPCRAEMPAIEKVYQLFKPLGFEVLAINATNQDNETSAASYAKELGLTFPILLDRTGELSARYTVRGYPASFIIDRKGIIRSVIVGGPMTEAMIQSKIEAILKETN